MIRIDITARWGELRSDPVAFRRYILGVFGADRIELAPFPYAALYSHDNHLLGHIKAYGYPRITVESECVMLELSDLIVAFGPERKDMRERLAALTHEQWSGWMRYLFAKSRRNSGGSVRIPAWAVERWHRQMNTPYQELSEQEKSSDLFEADKVLALFDNDSGNVAT